MLRDSNAVHRPDPRTPAPALAESFAHYAQNQPIEPVRTGPVRLVETQAPIEDHTGVVVGHTTARAVVPQPTAPPPAPGPDATRRQRIGYLIQLNADVIDAHIQGALDDAGKPERMAIKAVGGLLKVDIYKHPSILFLLPLKWLTDGAIDAIWEAARGAATWIDTGVSE